MNALCERLGTTVPIIQAPMGGAVGPALAAGVCRAGALGTLPLWYLEIADLRAQIAELRRLVDAPFAVNFNLNFPQEERLDACLSEQVPILSFFWGLSPGMIGKAKVRGAVVLQTVGSAAEAKLAVDAGADVVVAQGWEAGGHVWGTVATVALVPAVVDAVGNVPVVASGGIADGRGLAAAMALGAAGAWIGTRFLAAAEADVHRLYAERILAASEADTVYLEDLFDIGWPQAPHRVLRNSTVERWEQAGRPTPGNRPGEGDIIVRSAVDGPIARYATDSPKPDMEGELEALPMWAGQGAGLVRQIQPAEEIVREIDAEARAVLRRLGEAARG